MKAILILMVVAYILGESFSSIIVQIMNYVPITPYGLVILIALTIVSGLASLGILIWLGDILGLKMVA